MGDPQALIVTSSDKEEDGQQVMAQGNEEVKEDVESSEEPPDWLPDGWIMEIYHNDGGTFNKYYISPVSGCTFTTQSAVMKHLFSATDERILKAKETAEKNQFMRTHDWLPKGWQLEIRAGGKNMDKMYKFFVDPQAGVRLQSKEDVLLYKKGTTVSLCVTNGECDISSEDNILANVELNPDELLKGWVKEVAFRRTEKGLKKHLYYTDPVSHHTFRTLKSAVHYVKTGEIAKHPGRIIDQKTSVYDMYSFDKSADLHESLRSRLRVEESAQQKIVLSPIGTISGHTLDAVQDTTGAT